MKKIIFTAAILVGLSLATNAQTTPKKAKSESTKTETAKNKSTNAHTSCGEKGHVCSTDCKKAEVSTMKEHTCTNACTTNAHMYACGEKGHTCSAECKKMK